MTSRSILEVCYICLGKRSDLVHLVTIPENGDTESWIAKLRNCVAELNWSDRYQICEGCSNQIDFFYNFRQMCLKSHEERQDIFITVLEEQSKLKPTIYLCNKIPTKFENEPVISESFRCRECSRNFVSQIEFKEHCQKIHKEEDSDADNAYFGVDSVSDDDDSDSTLDSSSESAKPILEGEPTHRMKQMSHTKPTLKCYLCEKENIFDHVKLLVDHLINDHNIERKDVRPFGCDRCEGRFKLACDLRVHMKRHDKTRTEMCSYCSKRFLTRGHLRTHELRHQNKLEYQCTFCPKRFNIDANRREHEKIHTNPDSWKFSCHICSKKFYARGNLNDHLRRHNNIKPHACHLCGKRFCTRTDVRIHIISHTTARPFKCPHCDTDYKYKSHLNQHMARTHNVDNGVNPNTGNRKRHYCHLCPKSFSGKDKLMSHLCTHTGDKPFPCTVCNKRFTGKQYLNQHLKVVHHFIREANSSQSFMSGT